MRILLRQPPAPEQSLQLERLSIGRGTDQQIQLNDLRVALAHAEIVAAAGGRYELAAVGNASVMVNGAPRRGGLLAAGDQLAVGRYRLTLSAPPKGAGGAEHDLVLQVEEKVSAREERGQRLGSQRLSLAQAGLSRRRWSWLLVLSVLLASFALPFTLRYLWLAPLALDQQWLSGPVSNAHASFGGDCAQCHGAPFERVRDPACTTCHQNMAEHSADPALLAAGLGLQGGEQRCAACHREHNGAHGLISQHPQECTQCHAQLGPRFASLRPDASDFSRHHPPFTPRLARYTPGAGFTYPTLAQEANTELREDTNLKFPHDLHLAKKGIESPRGPRVLACADCHQPDRAGISFESVRMTAHCADCHRLDFDPGQPGRELPHGQPEEVVRIVRDYYAARALLGDAPAPRAEAASGLRRRPGEPGYPAASAAVSARQTAEQAVQDVFKRRVCHTCHEVEAGSGAAQPFRIAPVFLQEHALSGARFSHAAHRGETCESCHDARTSKDSREVLLPSIQDCRSCHGERHESGVVPSTCTTCHGFHIAAAGQP